MYHIILFYCSETPVSYLPGNYRVSVAQILTTLNPVTLWNKNVCEEEWASCTHLIGAEGEDAIQILY